MLLNNTHRKKTQADGFTLIELLVVAPIIILFIAGFVGVVISMTGSVIASKSSSMLTYNIQDALNRIEQDTEQSAAFLSTNSFTVTSPQGYGNDATSFHNADATNGPSLILNAYATTNNPVSLTTLNTIPAQNQPNACSSSSALLAQNALVYINIVYFVKNNTLWRRVVAPSNYPSVGCSIPWQQASCASGYSSTFCKTNDIDLVDGITTGGFAVSYYPTPSSSTVSTAASDSSQSDAARQTALLATNTVGITISASQSVSGRTIAQSATIRATSINNDTTGATTQASPTMTTQPSYQTVVTPATATFTAAATPTANLSVQWQQSTDSGSTWTNISGATTTTLTVTNTTVYMNGYLYRALFSNSSGSVTSNTATLTATTTGWTTMAMQNGWNPYASSTFSTASFRKTSAGLIVLKGLEKRSGAPVAGEVIGTLPIGYRPTNDLMFASSSNSTQARIDVWTDGTIHVQVGQSTWLSLEGINFMPAGTSFTALTPQPSWVNYTVSPYSNPLGYMQAADTRVSLKGTLSGGTSTDGTVMGTLPAAVQPSFYEQYAEMNVNTVQAIGIAASGTGTIQAKGYSANTYVGANALFYPSAYTGYTALTLQNSWVAFGGVYSTPRYTKSSDGMVLVKGDIKSGVITPAGTVITTLPTGYRPAYQSIFTVAVYNATTGFAGYGRVDVFANGNVTVGAANSVNATWTSLDSISFYADGT